MAKNLMHWLFPARKLSDKDMEYDTNSRKLHSIMLFKGRYRLKCEERDPKNTSSDSMIATQAGEFAKTFDKELKTRLNLKRKDCLGCKIIASATVLGIFGIISLQLRRAPHRKPEKITRPLGQLIVFICASIAVNEVWTTIDELPE
ncbi:hypothetical protein DPMN_094671 [Dreissena polymorpha]|uniref:Uncharacterized protein n=1 Tax=Dreissena polymorpha TaxID=45954 RepID=A0A9D4L555_DREPO|nr:hypothetical protein DPMN_094671 [Dreissena polymorpha]